MNRDNLNGQNENDVETQKIIAELNSKNNIQGIPFDPDIQQFIIPAAKSYRDIQLQLFNDKCQYKKLLFSTLYTASYVAFLTDTVALSNKGSSRQYIPPFIDYLNNIEMINKTSILKDFETFRVTEKGVKTQSTGTAQIINLINISLNYSPFINTLDVQQINYLDTLTKTKVAPHDIKTPKTICAWFGFHSWLRREDIGIGNEMFNRIASPKALTTSLRVTSEVGLYQIQQAKYALIEFFEAQNITPKNLSLMPPSPSSKGISTENYNIESKRWKREVYKSIRDRFSFLQESYYKISFPSADLTLAFEIILFSWCVDSSLADAIQCFKNNKPVKYFWGKNTRFLVSESPLFSHEFLFSLAEYSHSGKKNALPVSKIEHLLFQWLMAYQSVQFSDIHKLKLSNFHFLKRNNGQITHIESEYFKGRSNDTHQLKSINANSDMGRAILNFIDDRTIQKKKPDKELTFTQPAMSTAKKGTISLLIRLLSKSSIHETLNNSFQRTHSSSVFLDALYAIIENGLPFKKFQDKAFKDYQKVLNIDDWLLKCDSPSKWEIFGISSIKTSSIHARSDNFSPTQLQNYNSHNNNTERNSYLSDDNQEWYDNCGRVTRAVMQDIFINVLSPSKSQIQSYNTDFTRTSESINMRYSDVINRLKIITGKDNGRVNELGFITNKIIQDGDLPDTLYLIDSHETVMRFHHYIHEATLKHKLLSIRAQDHLLFTVLPTVEWMSQLLAERRFTKENLRKGKALFEKYEKILPSNFSAQLGE